VSLEWGKRGCRVTATEAGSAKARSRTAIATPSEDATSPSAAHPATPVFGDWFVHERILEARLYPEDAEATFESMAILLHGWPFCCTF